MHLHDSFHLLEKMQCATSCDLILIFLNNIIVYKQLVLVACPTNCKRCDWNPVTATATCTECLVGSYMDAADCLREYYYFYFNSSKHTVSLVLLLSIDILVIC